MKVIGTAGHIDHGKSTLVRHLTGIDPDRLAEEKRRGMTIDLGFAWLRLPSGNEVSIVDVPGHERFVKNMLAGAGGIDVALLVVAADEIIMPQTREHLAILDLLGIRHGVVALTKADLVDKEWLDLACEEVSDLLAGTMLAGSAVVPVSVVTGRGMLELLSALDRAVAASPEPVDMGVPYVPVDRVFTVSGFGTVVTGTLHQGSLRTDQEIVIVPGDKRGRIRTMQTHRQRVQSAGPGMRVALNLHGLSKYQIRRGDVVALPDTLRAAERMDVRVRVLADAPFALAHGARVSVHIGSLEQPAVLLLLESTELPAGASGWAQLRFSEPVAAVRGQRFILRMPSPGRTIAGGEIVDVAPHHRRRDEHAIDRLERLSSGSPVDAMRAALAGSRVRTIDYLANLLAMPEHEVQRISEMVVQQGWAVRINKALLSCEGWQALTDRIVNTLQEYHAANPLRRGMPREELRARVHMSSESWSATLQLLEQSAAVKVNGALVALPDHAGGTTGLQAEVDRVLRILEREPFGPPSGADLKREAGTDDAFLAALAEEGKIVKVDDGLFFTRDAYDRMIEMTVAAIRTRGQVTVADMRDILATSRKYALALLEHLDTRRITRRVGDARQLGTSADACE